MFKTYENKENITKDFIKNNSNDIRPISNDCNNGIDSKEISRLLLNQTKMTIKRASQYDIDLIIILNHCLRIIRTLARMEVRIITGLK